MSDSRNSRTSAKLSTLKRAEEAAKPTRIENALRGRAAKRASSVQSSPAAKMKSQGSRPRRVTKCVPLSAPARRISTTLSPGRTWRSRFAARVVNTSTRSLAANDPDLREDGIAVRGERHEGPVVVEEEQPTFALPVGEANLLLLRLREDLDREVLGEADGLVQAFEETHRPRPRVVAAEPFLHRPNPNRLFLGRHRDRASDCGDDLLHVVRIHGQGLAHLPRCARHLAEDQHPARLPPRGDVLLRDEVP